MGWEVGRLASVLCLACSPERNRDAPATFGLPRGFSLRNALFTFLQCSNSSISLHVFYSQTTDSTSHLKRMACLLVSADHSSFSSFMKIAVNTIAAIDYTLTDAQGKVLDSSNGQAPLEYLHGAQNIIPGLEHALTGLTTGEERKITVAPADGYGERDSKLLVTVSRQRFETDDTVEVGMRFHAQTQDGIRIMTVVNIAGDDVTLDGNHELAGQTLHFAVKVISVRDATAEEIAHGHPHRKGGCCGQHGHHHSGHGHCSHEH